MTNTDKLKQMLDNLIKDKSEQAQVVFHDYLQSKMQEVVQNRPGPTRGSSGANSD